MTIKVIHLHKLVKLFGAPENQLISLLRDDLRIERDKLQGADSGGGDFHLPFWTDAKGLVTGNVRDLPAQTKLRIEAHDGRKRLYPLMTGGFLNWFEQLKRGTNLPVGPMPEAVHNHYDVPGLELTIKVDNLLALKIGPDRHKLVYPYFSESPILSDKWARVALWLMREALPQFDITNMEILDILRGRSFAGASLFFQGDEEALVANKYREILAKWIDLRPYYGLD